MSQLPNNIMTGENFQKLCSIYIGSQIEDFLYNPNIGINDKNFILSDINQNFDNPKILFCYSHRLKDLSYKLDYFNNPFVLISGNSDDNINGNDIFLYIANHKNIITWYAQNLSIDHPKLKLLPIGIANSQWPHGNLKAFTNIMNALPDKVNDIYFQFKIDTNHVKRSVCYNELSHIVPFLESLPAVQNWERLATYKFCICPEGNGFDSHRIWECYYLKVIPIVLNNNFIQILKKQYNLPLIILQNWNDLRNISLVYEDYSFDVINCIYKSIENNIMYNE
jgi:hypothetical protein